MPIMLNPAFPGVTYNNSEIPRKYLLQPITEVPGYDSVAVAHYSELQQLPVVVKDKY